LFSPRSLTGLQDEMSHALRIIKKLTGVPKNGNVGFRWLNVIFIPDNCRKITTI
jgi:hypothetical protein